MHKLAKGLKKKKKSKKGKKGAEEEFDPEELERYRRERAEAQQKVDESGKPVNADSDEWRKFEALTAGVDSILKKTQGDLDRIKSTSFFQRKAPLEQKKPEGDQQDDAKKSSSKKWVGFDKDGNPIEEEPPLAGEKKPEKPLVSEDGFVEIPDNEDEHEDSDEEDIFDTSYIDVLKNIDVQLAYIPESPTEAELGDDPFDTTSADRVLKTVDKKGKKLVSLGNAVEVLAGRIDHVSTCKVSKNRKPRTQEDLLLDDFDEQKPLENVVAEPVRVEKTLLDDDSDLPDIPVDLTKLPPALPRPVTPANVAGQEGTNEAHQVPGQLLETWESAVHTQQPSSVTLPGIPDLDDFDSDIDADLEVTKIQDEEPWKDLASAADNASDTAKASGEVGWDNFDQDETWNNIENIIEADSKVSKIDEELYPEKLRNVSETSVEEAEFDNGQDPFDTTFAENILPGKTELKIIEKELEELPVSEVSISLTDPAGLNRDYETGLLTEKDRNSTSDSLRFKRDLLGGSTTDLSGLADQPIQPEQELTYVDPFDTSAANQIAPGKTELKFLEKELLGEEPVVESSVSIEDDDDFDPRKDEPPVKIAAPPRPSAPPGKPSFTEVNFGSAEEQIEADASSEATAESRKTYRPEALELVAPKVVAFELPTPSKRPDLLTTTEEEKSLPSKPLTPYYSQKSIEESLPADSEEADVDPFDTSFVAKVAPGKTELKLIESELLKQEPALPHSLSDHDFDPRATTEPTRRQSDFTAAAFRPQNLQFEQARDISRPKLAPKRQESLLDVDVEIDAKPLTPRIESKVIEEEEISYVDPFDTSIAINILPGKAELKLLENELEQITEPVQVRTNPIALTTVVAPTVVEEDLEFDPRAEEAREATDFLSLDDQGPSDKLLTPLQNNECTLDDERDPFDTSYANIEPGKTELKLLESELMNN